MPVPVSRSARRLRPAETTVWCASFFDERQRRRRTQQRRRAKTREAEAGGDSGRAAITVTVGVIDGRTVTV